MNIKEIHEIINIPQKVARRIDGFGLSKKNALSQIIIYLLFIAVHSTKEEVGYIQLPHFISLDKIRSKS